MTRTPVASRPCDEISRTGHADHDAADAITKISSSRPTMKAATTTPFLAVSLMPRTPWPPRPCRLNLSSWVRLPKPASVTMRMATSSRATSQETTSSLGLHLHAPHAGRGPAHGPDLVLGEADGHARLRLTMKMSSPPLVGMTRTSSSPSRRLMAMSPACSDESYSVNCVFFTWPLRVAKNRYRLVS